MLENDHESGCATYGADAFVKAKEENKKKTKPGVKICSLFLSGLLFGAAAAGAFAGVSTLLNKETESSEQREIAYVETSTDKSGQNAAIGLSAVSYSSNSDVLSQALDVSDIAEGMMPAMVSITNVSVAEVQSYFGMFGRCQTQTQESQSSGTGIIIGENDSELLIVTNNHVVEDATTLSVCFVDNEVCEATIKGTDPDNDLAVIAVKLTNIKEETAESIKIARIGNSDTLKVGQQVVAIGKRSATDNR